MTVYKYITLSNSTGTPVKRYSAIGFSPPMMRGDTIDFTLGGKLDKQNGPITKQKKYTLRVPIDTPSDANYGTYNDLKTLFELANSNLSPSDVILLYDHFGTPASVYFVGDAMPEPLTTQLSGPNAWYTINVTFQEIT
jgi:hypothetical protein